MHEETLTLLKEMKFDSAYTFIYSPRRGTLCGAYDKSGGAAQTAARAPADGYTVLITTNTTHAANQHLYKKLPYDAVKDFAPITGSGKGARCRKEFGLWAHQKYFVMRAFKEHKNAWRCKAAAGRHGWFWGKTLQLAMSEVLKR